MADSVVQAHSRPSPLAPFQRPLRVGTPSINRWPITSIFRPFAKSDDVFRTGSAYSRAAMQLIRDGQERYAKLTHSLTFIHIQVFKKIELGFGQEF